MNLQRLLEIGQALDLNSFQQTLVDLANELEFPLVSAVLLVEQTGPGRRPDVFAVSNAPQEFLEATHDREKSARDPVTQRLRQLSTPFFYDQSLYVREGAGDLWEEQAAFGYRNGVAVALHLPEQRHFLLGVDRDSPLPTSDHALVRMMADLQLLAVHAQAAAVQLMLPQQEQTPAVRLTRRELEVLRLTMEGKQAWQVGMDLGMSEHTVAFHVKNVLRKLGTSTKHEAVFKAMKLGLL